MKDPHVEAEFELPGFELFQDLEVASKDSLVALLVPSVNLPKTKKWKGHSQLQSRRGPWSRSYFFSCCR